MMMSDPEEWAGSLAEEEADLAAFDAGLRESGVSGEVRAELSDRFRELELLGPDDPARVVRVLGLMVEVFPLLEAELRGAGHDEVADDVARFTVGLALWLEMPADLVAFAGHPCSQNEREEPYE